MTDFYRVIGVDPALVNTGLVVVESPRPNEYRVVARATVATRPRIGKKGAIVPLLDRLRTIREGVAEFLAHASLDGERLRASAVDGVAIEGGMIAKNASRGKNVDTLVVMGIAVGVSVATVIASGFRVDLFAPDEWMPRVRGSRGAAHTMDHANIVRFLHRFIAIPDGATEHEIMAAGVARRWIEDERLRRLRHARGIVV